MRPKIAVCIATYKRLELLSRLLESLTSLRVPDDHDLEFRIVDNDVNGSARSNVVDWTRSVDPERAVFYTVAPVANISLARNRALEMGPADFVLFFDDDEAIDPDCLVKLMRTLCRTNSDIAIGYVACVHPDGTPAWVRRGKFLDHPTGESGELLPWRGTRCGCTLVLGSWFYAMGFRFDPAYGRSGGEDPGAIAREAVLLERTRFRYFWRRAWRTGLCYHRIERNDADRRFPPSRFVLRLAKSAWTLLTGLPAAVVGRPERLIRGLLVLPMATAGLVAWLRPHLAQANESYGHKPEPVAPQTRVA
jgi:succinoglycan biosynthesis protein ExoM